MVLVQTETKKRVATFIGFGAVLLWSLLAVLTKGSGDIPPFQLTAMALTIGAVVGIIYQFITRQFITLQDLSPFVLILGIFGIFGYHFFYFTALSNAPPVEAGLIAYLWPVLIILFSALLPGEKLRWFHIVGGALGLVGAILIVSDGGQVVFKEENAFGYCMALLCALTWSGYSVLSRRYSNTPTSIITVFCIIGAILSALCHALLEDTVIPTKIEEWFSVTLLGLGPVGLAFYVWDYGVKHGNIQILGASSYLAPLLSTLVLIMFGYSELTWLIAAAALLITGGAVLASKDILKVASKNP